MAIEISDQLATELLDPEGCPQSLVVAGKTYKMDAPVAQGYKGVVWRVIDDLGRPRALKLAIPADYEDRSYRQEISRAVTLEGYQEFAHLVDGGPTDVALRSGNTRLIAFVETWIPGHTLEAFLRLRGDTIGSTFMVAYVQAACRVLHALEKEGLQHDDLHARNIMLSPPPAGSMSDEWLVRVIDMGSLKPRVAGTTKAKDDHRHVVDHLIAIWNAIHRRRTLPTADRRFLQEARNLIQLMLDDDLSVALRQPAQIASQFESAFTRSRSPRSPGISTLKSPFDYLSAEHIADDQVLVNLFADSCPWLGRVSGPDPCLLTGPRGCGKSTIFRWLSLKAHLLGSKPLPEDLRIAGFYVSCSADLQNRLGWMATLEVAERFQAEIVHYFNLVLAREVAHTLALIAGKADRETYWGLGSSEEASLRAFLLTWIARPDEPAVQGIPRLAQVVEAIESEMLRTHLALARRSPLEKTTSAAFLGDLTDLLVKLLPRFRERRIVFLVDDFSLHRLPEPVQRILNRIIWERRPSHVFKLSSEKYGAVLTDAHGASIDIGREMVEIDCGQHYISLEDSGDTAKAKAFAVDLLDHRLKAAGYAGTAAGLIGPSSWTEGSLARAIVANPHGNNYHGLDCIAQLCSGDVASLLQVYSSIFRNAKVTPSTTSPVSAKLQHEAVRDVSRRVLENIRPAFPHGPKMHEVVSAFGRLVRRLLEEGRPQKHGKSTVPTQCPRIEIDQPAGAVADSLSPEQRQLALELVRRAIFVEMTPGLSRHDNMTTLRWHLRRIFLPTFGAALSKNVAVKENADWLKFFLTNPDESCEAVFRAWPKKSGDGEAPNESKSPNLSFEFVKE